MDICTLHIAVIYKITNIGAFVSPTSETIPQLIIMYTWITKILTTLYTRKSSKNKYCLFMEKSAEVIPRFQIADPKCNVLIFNFSFNITSVQ